VEVKFQIFITSELDRGEWLAPHSSCFTTREKAPNICWEGVIF